MRVPARLFPHTVVVELPSERRLPGGGAVPGESFGPVRGYGEGQVKRSRNMAGEELVTDVTVWLDPEHEIPTGAVLTVTIPGRTAPLRGTVQVVLPKIAPGVPSHVEYRCSGG